MKIKYFAKDGTEFNSRTECLAYEETLALDMDSRKKATENRIGSIKNFAENRDREIAEKERMRLNRIEELKQIILSYGDRIINLIDTANACVENGIKIYYDSPNYCNYDHNHFVTDGWCHQLGFDFNYHCPSKITRIGKRGGGCCDFNVFTDGRVVTTNGGADTLRALENFVAKFDEFESKFYAYVDKICNK